MLTGLENSECLHGHLFHAFEIARHPEGGKVSGYACSGVADDPSIRRMGRDQVDRIFLNLVKVPGITEKELYLPLVIIGIERPVGEVQPIPGYHQGIMIDVDTDGVSSKQLAFDCGRSASDHLVEY